MLNLPVKILIVDDHPAFRDGMRGLLNTQISFKVMAEAENAKEAWRYLEKTDIDLVLLDINMPGTNGIELASQLRTRYPELIILMLTMYEEDQYVRRAMAAGANGCSFLLPEGLPSVSARYCGGEYLQWPRRFPFWLQSWWCRIRGDQ